MPCDEVWAQLLQAPFTALENELVQVRVKWQLIGEVATQCRYVDATFEHDFQEKVSLWFGPSLHNIMIMQ